jgi:hypothetical protein
MESKAEMYLERAQSASHAADGAERTGILEIAKLYRKVALLWREMALLERRWPANPV